MNGWKHFWLTLRNSKHKFTVYETVVFSSTI